MSAKKASVLDLEEPLRNLKRLVDAIDAVCDSGGKPAEGITLEGMVSMTRLAAGLAEQAVNVLADVMGGGTTEE